MHLAGLVVDDELYEVIVCVAGLFLKGNGVTDLFLANEGFYFGGIHAGNINDLQDVIFVKTDQNQTGPLIGFVVLDLTVGDNDAVGLAAGVVGGVVQPAVDAGNGAVGVDQRVQRYTLIPPGINGGQTDAGGVLDDHHGAGVGGAGHFHDLDVLLRLGVGLLFLVFAYRNTSGCAADLDQVGIHFGIQLLHGVLVHNSLDLIGVQKPGSQKFELSGFQNGGNEHLLGRGEGIGADQIQRNQQCSGNSHHKGQQYGQNSCQRFSDDAANTLFRAGGHLCRFFDGEVGVVVLHHTTSFMLASFQAGSSTPLSVSSQRTK